jgi:hypothetical protein
METPQTPTDPLNVVRSLDADAIRKRIDDLDAERQALMVLLRAAQRMDRAGAGSPSRAKGGKSS